MYYHVSDGYATPETEARGTYYGIYYIPDCWFDGWDNYVGGPSNVKTIYQGKINTHLNDPSPLIMDIQGGFFDIINGRVDVHIEVAEPFTETNLRLRTVLWENGLGSYNLTVRDILPVVIPSISDVGDTLTTSWDFTLNATWQPNNMGIGAFVQSDNNKMVLQACRWDIPDMTIIGEVDDPVVPRGGTLGYTATVTNVNSTDQITMDAWGDVTKPDGNPYPGNPVVGPQRVRLNPKASKSKHLTQKIPNVAPLGTYTYTLKLGTYPDEVTHEYSFEFTVTEGSGFGRDSDGWELIEGDFFEE